MDAVRGTLHEIEADLSPVLDTVAWLAAVDALLPTEIARRLRTPDEHRES